MNKDLAQPLDDLFKARLDILLKTLNETYNVNGMVLESEILSLYNTAINTFYTSLDKSITGSIPSIKSGLPADPNIFNRILSAIEQDLLVLYNEIYVLDKMVSANFNSITIEREEILQTNKRIADKLGDYLLYVDPSLGAGFFFSDDFNTADKLDIDSSLIEAEPCFHDINEGILLLPLDGEPIRPEVKSITINDVSNGIAGNNHQIGVYGHNAVEAISDGKPNTWFEYEKVSSNELLSPLILDLTFTLKETSVINHINILPIFFGTSSPIIVTAIETSKDGTEFLSIKDEVPIKDFVSTEEENLFELSAASSNFSGGGFYSFLARKAKYVHIILHQYTPYTIETINGDRLRYAIGIKDINILSRKFQSSGSIVSSLFNISEEAKKISLWASENPIEVSSLADISHFISHNNGGIWYPIQPQHRVGLTIPEVLNFNTLNKSSIDTDEGVTGLKHKISMTRNPDAFKGEQIIKTEEVSALEVINVPGPTEPEITLKHPPVESSIVITMPYIGSFSCPRSRYGSSVIGESAPMTLDFVEFTVDAPGTQSGTDGDGSIQQEGSLRYNLPYKDIPYLSEKIRVFVNGAQIEYMPKDPAIFDNPTTSPISTLTVDDTTKIYYLNKSGTELQFGYLYRTDSGNYQKGFVPSAGSKIQICLDGDNPQVELTENNFVLKLLAPTDGYKETVSLVALRTVEEESAFQYEIEIPVGVNTFQDPRMVDISIGEYTSGDDTSSFYKIPVFLSGTSNFEIKEYELDGTLITGSDRQFSDKEDYINGRFDLRDFFGATFNDKYTFDSDTGTIYLGSKTRADRRTVLVCKKLELEKIDNSLWEFETNPSTGAINPQHISLDPTAVYTVPQSTTFSLDDYDFFPQKSFLLMSGNTNSHSWFNRKIVKGTVRPSLSLFTDNASLVEVDFIDGVTEFSSIGTIEKEPITFTSLGSNLYSFTLSEASSTRTLVGTPAFAPVRSTDSVTIPTNIFSLSGQVSSTTTNLTEGQWYVTTSSGTVTVTVYTTSTPGDHTVTYRINDIEKQAEASGMFSVDYYNGVIYFASPIAADGNVSYEVSMYSAFYNIGKIISQNDIEEVLEEDKKIIFKSAFALQFLKQDIVDKNRPQVLKVSYNYYKTISESLADLEPYFSPICKHIGLRAVTSSLLEEL